MNAQVAIIDAYKGSAKATPRIADVAGKKNARSEELRYNSVVAVNPGSYEVVLADEDGEAKAKTRLVAVNHESYVILRAGVEAQQGPSFPQELVVYPQSDAKLLHSGAETARTTLALLASLFAVMAM